MNIQSLSVVVPGGCPNKCKFCVAKMNEEPYPDKIEDELAFLDLHERDFVDRLSFARDNGCNTIILTGNGEPLCNISFLNFFSECNEKLEHPFRWIELQTSGVTLLTELEDENAAQAKLRWLRNKVRVSTISLSLSDIFSSVENAGIMQTPLNLVYNLDFICKQILRYGFNLRISVNLTNAYDYIPPRDIMARLKYLGANQITFRKLFAEGDTEQAKWVKNNALNVARFYDLENHVINFGRKLEVLPFGAQRYAIDGMSVVMDTDCMSTQDDNSTIRYMILRPNCKLYTKWDDLGSILF